MIVNSFSVLSNPRDIAFFAFPTTSGGMQMAPTPPGDMVSFQRYSSGKNWYCETETVAPVLNRTLVGNYPSKLSG